jgi:mannose-6-phosphate isomerase-like protein (cupin superfamily)
MPRAPLAGDARRMTSMPTTIANPVTGERVRWHLTSADTGGRLVRAERWVRPGGAVGFGGAHRQAEERFEVLAGRMTADLDGRVQVVGRGDRIAIPPRVPRRLWNGDDAELHFLVDVLFAHPTQGGTP